MGNSQGFIIWGNGAIQGDPVIFVLSQNSQRAKFFGFCFHFLLTVACEGFSDIR